MKKDFDVQSISLGADIARAFAYIADPKNLPQWTAAFARADEHTALMVTPQGELEVQLEVKADADRGTIDWYMTMPNSDVAAAYSRLVPNGTGSIYTFILKAPPVPIEQVEGALAQQIELLRGELQKLSEILR